LKCGHKPIVLMGGGTTRIGDDIRQGRGPSLLDDAEIARNMAGLIRFSQSSWISATADEP
jgi:tyrosyl-tRNA synthetase